MSDSSSEPQRIPLRVLPDPRRMERILRDAEQWQAQSRQAKEAQPMSQTETPIETSDPAAPPEERSGPARAIEKKLLEGRIIETLRSIYDPELPVNIYDLGLIYAIDISDPAQGDDAPYDVDIRMTLTAPACPVAGQIVAEVQRKVHALPEIARADVELVWDPPWSREMIGEAARLDLGL